MEINRIKGNHTHTGRRQAKENKDITINKVTTTMDPRVARRRRSYTPSRCLATIAQAGTEEVCSPR